MPLGGGGAWRCRGGIYCTCCCWLAERRAAGGAGWLRLVGGGEAAAASVLWTLLLLVEGAACWCRSLPGERAAAVEGPLLLAISGVTAAANGCRGGDRC